MRKVKKMISSEWNMMTISFHFHERLKKLDSEQRVIGTE